MADIRCPNCGKNNPDFLDVCQFCQAPLTSSSLLQIGQSPTKKNTGELEPILPEWLRDVRQQSRESAEEGELPASATQPRVQKNEAPDLLAGLASSQSDEEEDDIPDWLASINPVAKSKPVEPSKPEPANDFFAQFNQSKPAPEKTPEPPQEETPAWMGGVASSQPEQPAEKDELAEWLSSASKEPNEPFAFPSSGTQGAPEWMGKETPQPAPEEKEDLSWLHNLEAAAKQSEEPSQPNQDVGWNFNEPSAPSSSQEDLSWLNNLGGTPAQPASSQPPQGDDLRWLNDLGGTVQPAQPASSHPSQPEDLSWLNALGGTPEPAQPASAKPAQPDDLSWLDAFGGTSQPAQPASQPSQQEDLSWLNTPGGTSEPAQPTSSQPEDLSWLNNLGGTSEPVQPAPSQPAPSDDMSWLDNLGGTTDPAQPASAQEDLDWLGNLGGTPIPAKPTAEPAATEDLGWLNTLGGTTEPEQPPAAPTSSQGQEDLGWLREFGGISESAREIPLAQDDLGWMKDLGGVGEPVQQEPSTSGSDLGWLDTVGGTSTPAQPEPASSSTDELDWLKNFAGSTSEPAQPASGESIELGWLDTLSSASEPARSATAEPASSQADVDWLAGLGETSSIPGFISAKPFGTTEELNPPQELGNQEPDRVSPFVPRKTAPLGDAFNDDMPDWLKKATEETPNLPLGAGALEQFRETPRKPAEETPPSTPMPDYVGSNVFSTSSTPQSISNQDIDSLFSMDMPDWLSKPQPESGDIPSQSAETPVRDETLSPVDLPSWVQAMRPVESVLEETGPSIETQPTEKEGPLAGLRGVIPSAPIGSSRRPKAVSLKLQATDEQQAGASLFDQILASEIKARVTDTAPAVTSQKVLRWTIAGVLLVVLGAILLMRSQFLPVSWVLPNNVNTAADAINAIPNNSLVLVVVDYEASLAGEMEAISAPVLNQIILGHHPELALLATSPQSAGLIERLLSNANIRALPTSSGSLYAPGNGYINLGYLPGGSAGILGFISQPQQAFPSLTIQSFANYSAVILLTDNAESGRAWLEQLDIAKQSNPDLANQSMILVTSAQTGPMLQPYVSSGQAAGMVNGLAEAARFDEAVNSIPKENRITRTYWDAFGIGILMAVLFMTIGSVWSLIDRLRARRASGEQG